jgi:para-aminobenzoate synthetase component 1
MQILKVINTLLNMTATTQKPITISAKALILNSDITSQTLFSHLAHKPWAMWLDSCNTQHVNSRFDIIAWQPIATLQTQGNNTEIFFTDSQKAETSHEDPLHLLHQLQEKLFTQAVESHDFLPFLGGALGYFSYDLGRRFEKLPSMAEQDINLPDMAIGLYSQAIIFDNQNSKFYLVCPEDNREQLEQFIKQELAVPAKKTITFKLTDSWQANMNKASYIEKFNQVQKYLLSGDCYQINLAQRFSAHYQGDEFQAYLALRAANKAPFSAFIRLESSAILSVSPERFLALKNNKVQSKPIKGTMPRSGDSREDAKNAEILRHSTKDNAENLMIVDLLRNDISRSCQAGTVKVPKLFDIESFPAVHHLVSTVEGQLAQGKNATDLLRGAFPGGSITGAPKIRAMEIIEELEPHRRSIYCGAIGYISNCGNMDTSITIRTLICEQADKPSKNKLHCWAGGGLVADSTAHSEYQETYDKVKCILPVLSDLNQV